MIYSGFIPFSHEKHGDFLSIANMLVITRPGFPINQIFESVPKMFATRNIAMKCLLYGT